MNGARALACGLLLALCACRGDPPSPAEPSSPVESARVTRGAIEQTVTALGVVEPDPDSSRSVIYPRSGRIDSVYVASGDAVAKDAPLLGLGPMPADSADVQRARVEADAARRDLERVRRLHADRLADGAALAAAQAASERAELALSALGAAPKTPVLVVRAPQEGVVASALPAPGTLVTGGSTALELAPRRALLVRVSFSSEDVARLHPDLAAEVEPLFAAPDAALAHGHLVSLRALVDPDTQQLDGIVRLDDAPPWLASGARVRVHTIVARRDQAVRVPREALVQRGDGVGVFVADDGRAHWRALELGVESDDAVEARSGVSAGESVITAGRSALEDGARVREAGPAAQP